MKNILFYPALFSIVFITGFLASIYTASIINERHIVESLKLDKEFDVSRHSQASSEFLAAYALLVIENTKDNNASNIFEASCFILRSRNLNPSLWEKDTGEYKRVAKLKLKTESTLEELYKKDLCEI
jgi:hypothetical protein